MFKKTTKRCSRKSLSSRNGGKGEGICWERNRDLSRKICL